MPLFTWRLSLSMLHSNMQPYADNASATAAYQVFSLKIHSDQRQFQRFPTVMQINMHC